MDKRKVMKLGSSSLVVSLPREWLDKFKVEKGDDIGFDIRTDGALILTPKSTEKMVDNEIEIIVSNDFEKGRIERKLVAAYLGNFSKIRIKAETKFKKQQILEIRKKLSKLTGCQIIESSLNEMIIQNLLKIKDFDVNKGIYRAYLITLSMFKDTINSLKDLNIELMDGVIQIDDDVDQFYFLILKQLRNVLLDFKLMNKLNLTPVDCLDYFMIMQRIEHIADHIVMIANRLKAIVDFKLEKSIMDLFKDLFMKVNKIFEGSIDSFLLGNVDIANKIINENNNLRIQRPQIGENLDKNKGEINKLVLLVSIIDSLYRISDYATDIAEVAINRSV
jgi:phosphate uptake regulator